MNPVIHDISEILVAQGHGPVGGTGNWAIFRHVMPDAAPDKAVGLYDYPGPGPTGWNEIGVPFRERVAFQLRVRGRSASEVFAKITELSVLLEAVVTPMVMNGAKYHFIRRGTDYRAMGIDQRLRFMYSANFDAARIATTGAATPVEVTPALASGITAIPVGQAYVDIVYGVTLSGLPQSISAEVVWPVAGTDRIAFAGASMVTLTGARLHFSGSPSVTGYQVSWRTR